MRRNLQNSSQPQNNPKESKSAWKRLVLTREDPQASQALVDRANGGDAEALNRLLEILREHLARRVGFELARRNLYLAEFDQEDLVQDVLIQLWTVDLLRFDATKASLGHFATKRLRWMLIDRIRKHARQSTSSLQSMKASGVPEPEAHGHDPATVLEATAREQTLAAVIPQLLASAAAHNDDQAAYIVQRHDVENVPLKAIAEETGRHPANVTRARQRAMRYVHVELLRRTTFFAA